MPIFVLAAIAVVLWLPLASWVAIVMIGKTLPGVQLTYDPAAWIDLLSYWHASWRISAPLALSGALAAMPAVLAVILAVRLALTRRLVPKLGALDATGLHQPVRGRSGNHGDADWMPLEHAKELLRPSPTGEPFLVIGEAYRVDQDRACITPFNERDSTTWGQGGKAQLLVDPCTSGPTHAFICAGSGGLKTTSSVTRLMCWTGSAIVLDPSNEIGPMCRPAREAMGQDVIMLGLGGAGLNILASINPRSATADRRLLSAVAALCGEEVERDKNAIFSDAGRKMVTAILGHMLWDPELPARDKTLAFFRELIAAPAGRLRKMLEHIAKHSRSSMARFNAAILVDLADETFTSAYFNATQFCAWLFNDAIADMLSGGSLRAADIVHRPMTVFVHVPLDILKTTPAAARVILDALAWAFIDADGIYQSRTLMLVDEASKIGNMAAIDLVRDVGRKYGLTLCLSYLSDAELDVVWGKGGASRWKETVAWYGYGSVGDPNTAEALSKAFGEYGVLAASEGSTDGQSGRAMEARSRSRGSSINTHEQSRRLIFAHELLAARRDELFVFRKTGQPIRCGQPAYFRRTEIACRVLENRFEARRAAE